MQAEPQRFSPFGPSRSHSSSGCNTHVDLFVLPQSHVYVSQRDGHRVESRPVRAPAMFVPSRHGEVLGGVAADFDCSVIAPTLEMVESAIEGDVVGVSVDVAGGLVWKVAAQDAILHFTDLASFAPVWVTDQAAVFCTATSAETIRLPERLSFLLGTGQRKR